MQILLEGEKASNLSFKNYKSKIQEMDFPKIPQMAFEISYLYRFDGYLPSFIFNLIYKVPLNNLVPVYETKHDGTVRMQTFVDEGNFRIVSYTEFQEC